MCEIALTQHILLYRFTSFAVMSDELAPRSAVCGTLVGVSVFSAMCSELLIMSEIS